MRTFTAIQVNYVVFFVKTASGYDLPLWQLVLDVIADGAPS